MLAHSLSLSLMHAHTYTFLFCQRKYSHPCSLPALSITAFNLEASVLHSCIHPAPALALLIGWSNQARTLTLLITLTAEK